MSPGTQRAVGKYETKILLHYISVYDIMINSLITRKE